MDMQRTKRAWTVLARALRTIGQFLWGDRPASRKPPVGNYIPNSNGEGGRVISSGHPGSGA